jgi:hypothetical protein
MSASERFEQYMELLCSGLGHADRYAGLRGYCTGLMLPIARKSVEPMAASLDPLHTSARHQSLHHFVAHAEWSDDEMLRRVAQWVVPHMDVDAGACWIIDDTGYPKKGKHSVGVARQYCGQLGKQDNCQVAVSISLASETASLPVAYRLYLDRSPFDGRHEARKALSTDGWFGRLLRTGNRPAVDNALLLTARLPRSVDLLRRASAARIRPVARSPMTNACAGYCSSQCTRRSPVAPRRGS